MGAAVVEASGGDTTKSPVSKKTTITTEGSKDVVPAPADPSDNSKALAPPPRPDAATGNTPDFFNGISGTGGSLSLEPNPFEQSFGGGAPETPGGTKLPSVAALTSPASLLPGANGTPFWPGGSLRTGPLSPAMLSGPTGDYFTEAHHIRGGFPTPNESSLRTGLTPGGSGSMFPAPSPGGAAFLNQLASGGVTPSTIDFHRTAINAAAAKRDLPGPTGTSTTAVTSQPADLTNGTSKATAGQYDPHDSDAANGLFMLAQGRNAVPPPPTYAVPQHPTASHPPAPPAPPSNASPEMSNRSINGTASGRDMSEAASEENEMPKPNTRAKGKKVAAQAAGTRRKAEEVAAKAPPNKKAKTNAAAAAAAAAAASAAANGSIDSASEDDDDDRDEDGPKGKMTEEDKRKNFLERNRVAALKCRQRKKQWLANLQQKVEIFSSENDALNNQINSLREEVVNLKTLLLAHKDCPVTQQQGLHTFMQQQHGAMDQYNAQINPYQMAAPIPSQQVIAGQAVNRRFS